MSQFNLPRFLAVYFVNPEILISQSFFFFFGDLFMICRAFLVCLLMLTLPAVAAQYSLRLIGDLNFPTQTYVKNTLMGGLSGITYNKHTGELIAISDDRSKNQPSRIYRILVNVNLNYFSARPYDVHFLRNQAGGFYPENYFDGEGIALIPNSGSVIVSSEGNFPVSRPEITAFNPFGHFVSSVILPAEYQPEYDEVGNQTGGVAVNRGLESLAISSDGDFLWTANEATLVQDLGVAPYTSRVLQYKQEAQGYQPQKVFTYPYGPSNLDELDLANEELGVTEIAAMNDQTLFVLERQVNMKAWTNRPAIYSVRLEGEILQKRKVLDLVDIIPYLSWGYRSLDNLEGMAFGPYLPNGNRSLFVISDNNFNGQQRTQLLAFEVRVK